MRRTRFRFEGDLMQFLAPELRGGEFEHSWADTDRLKHVIESLGVPHTEVARTECDGDLIRVYPHAPEHLTDARFVLDGHLGRLGAYLRMLGLDVEYEQDAADDKLAGIASAQDRVLLTRDIGLLKRKEVRRGYFVRATEPRAQLEELVRRYRLRAIAPFTRCLRCNTQLREISKELVAERLPPRVSDRHTEFKQCPSCGRVYWKGSHYDRMNEWIDRLMKTISAAPQSGCS